MVDVRVYRVLALERPQRAFHHLRIEMGIIIDERALINVPAPRPAIPFHPVENEFLFAKPEGVEGNVEDLLKLFIFALKGAFRLVGRFLYRNEFLIRPFRKGEQISERLRALRRRNPLFGNDYVRLLAVLLVERLFPRFAVIAINGSLRAVKPDACRHFPAEIVKYSSALNLLFEVRRLFDGQAVGIGAIVGGVEYPARRGVKYVVLTGDPKALFVRLKLFPLHVDTGERGDVVDEYLHLVLARAEIYIPLEIAYIAYFVYEYIKRSVRFYVYPILFPENEIRVKFYGHEMAVHAPERSDLHISLVPPRHAPVEQRDFEVSRIPYPSSFIFHMFRFLRLRRRCRAIRPPHKRSGDR